MPPWSISNTRVIQACIERVLGKKRKKTFLCKKKKRKNLFYVKKRKKSFLCKRKKKNLFLGKKKIFLIG